MFAWPLGAALPVGPSKSTSIRGWIRGSTSRLKSSRPVGTSKAGALAEASNKANQAHDACLVLFMMPPDGAALITFPCAVQCARSQRERHVVKELELPPRRRSQRGQADAAREVRKARVGT